MFIADFHLHSKYSRATSKYMDAKGLYTWAKIKGIDVIGTGDFTHPKYFKELQEDLIPLGNGLFQLKGKPPDVLFLLSCEISCIYSKYKKTRRNHIILIAPGFEEVAKINEKLGKIGNLASDGRPILGLDSRDLVKIALDVSDRCMAIPAHIWTPWFSTFGSKSGFDSLSECYDDMTPYIYAVETGLSSDPPMNWRIKDLEHITLVSNSDAHSFDKLGREANVFNGDKSYDGICDTLKHPTKQNFLYTIEFYPEEGKYHYDGHVKCGISLSPQESKKLKDICPVCHRPLTIGVMHRTDDLASKTEMKEQNRIPFKHIVPLREIISDYLNKRPQTKAVDHLYTELITKVGHEFHVLLDAEIPEIGSIDPILAQGIQRMREQKLYIKPGYDGEYGHVKIFEEKTKGKKQNTLF